MKDVTYNLTITSNSGRMMTLVFTSYNDLISARSEARKIGYRNSEVYIGHTVECTVDNTLETLKLYNK